MKYKNIVRGTFIERPNRFIAKVEIDGTVQTVHVKNTGRCKELLQRGTMVYLEKSDNPLRKTLYDLVKVEKDTPRGKILVNMDSQAPNKIAAEFLPKCGLFSPNAIFRSEVPYKSSRFDFCIIDGNTTSYLEVKGVTLENDGIAAFPDAPTERGVKHITELMECKKEGYGAYILFVIQMKGVAHLIPNDATHPAFGDALRRAKECGVKILAVDCIVTEDEAAADKFIPVIL